MSTLLLEVNAEQEEALSKLLQYMNIPFQKITSGDDFMDALPATVRHRIEQGKADADAGRYEPAQAIIQQMLTQAQ